MLNKSKLTYILLTSALVVCVGGMGFLGYSILSGSSVVKMQNFENASKTDVLKWVTKNKLEENIKYEYEYSDTVEEGNVISQSIKENDKVEGEFTVTISKGSIIKLDINEYKTKAEFDSFIAKYPKVKVTYEEGDFASDNSELLRFSKNSVDIKSDQLKVYLAKTTDSKDDNKDDEKDNTGDKVTIPNNLLGIEESKFIKTLNDLGFKNLKKSDTKYYSFTSKKDMIYSYDDGKFDTSKTINYALSLGDYPTLFDAKEYNGQSLDTANKLVKKYNDLNAHITLKTNSKETTDTKSVGKLANCTCKKSNNTSIITCDLYTSKSEVINVPSYSGKTVDEMKTALNDLGITKITQNGTYYSSSIPSGKVYSNDTGSKVKTDTIYYKLSLGAYSFNANEFNGKTKTNAQNIVNNYNNLGANIEFKTNSPTETEDQSKNNIIFDCGNASGGKNIITCSIYEYIEKYNIINPSMIIDMYTGNSYDETVSKLNNLFDKFTNVHYVGVEGAEIPGVIKKVTVDGIENYDTQIKYRTNVNITIEIVKNQRN